MTTQYIKGVLMTDEQAKTPFEVLVASGVATALITHHTGEVPMVDELAEMGFSRPDVWTKLDDDSFEAKFLVPVAEGMTIYTSVIVHGIVDKSVVIGGGDSGEVH